MRTVLTFAVSLRGSIVDIIEKNNNKPKIFNNKPKILYKILLH